MNLPEGWPTKEMVNAAAMFLHERSSISLERCEWLAELMINAALAAAPTPPAQEDETVAEIRLEQGERVIDLTRIMELPVGTKLYTRPVVTHESGNMLHNEQEDKPVAEIKLINGLPKVVAIVGYGDLIPGSLLYTRPDDRLRKAAEDLIEIWETPTGSISDLVNKINPIIENLRAALEGNKPL